ncbi:hypothetical protein COCON_G00128480 [Conger conger]|uniref:C2H2-type domain-containing protein n=1 Tax=Conger conger TaxID=82655 RepID=A0A9Q1DDI5_CONCO|nr:hypothetical protein COCON_G00128480 [Conger conger]
MVRKKNPPLRSFGGEELEGDASVAESASVGSEDGETRGRSGETRGRSREAAEPMQELGPAAGPVPDDEEAREEEEARRSLVPEPPPAIKRDLKSAAAADRPGFNYESRKKGGNVPSFPRDEVTDRNTPGLSGPAAGGRSPPRSEPDDEGDGVRDCSPGRGPGEGGDDGEGPRRSARGGAGAVVEGCPDDEAAEGDLSPGTAIQLAPEPKALPRLPLLSRGGEGGEDTACLPGADGELDGGDQQPSSPKLQDFKCNICGYGYYGNDPTDLIKHFRKYHLGLHNRTRQDAELDTKILALHNMVQFSAQSHTKDLPRLHAHSTLSGVLQDMGSRPLLLNGTYDVQVTLGGTLIGIGRKTPDCQGNTKYFRCKFCNFTYIGSSSSELEQHFLSAHPNKMKTHPPSARPESPEKNEGKGNGFPRGCPDPGEAGRWADRVAVTADDDSIAGYLVPIPAGDPHGQNNAEGGQAGYYWCKYCSYSCEAPTPLRLLEHYEKKHSQPGGTDCAPRDDPVRGDPDPPAKRKDAPGKAASAADPETVVTSYNCQFCDFRYSMSHGPDVIVVAPLLRHYQQAHSIHKCTIKHCPFCPRGLCSPEKHLGEISYPFACRKSNCSHCAMLLLEPAPAGLPRAKVKHLCDQCPYSAADIDLLLLHYDSVHSAHGVLEVKPEEEPPRPEAGANPAKEPSNRCCTKCDFVTEVEEEIYRHYRRVHGCCRCRHCSFTAADTAALLEHFNSAHCQDPPDPCSAPTNGCSVPSNMSIKEESKGDLKLYSLVPPEARPAEAGVGLEGVKREALDEKEPLREKVWGEATGGGGGGEQARGLLWVPKERAVDILRGSPLPYGQGSLGLLNAVAVSQEPHQQKSPMLRDSPGLVFGLGADSKGFMQGLPGTDKTGQMTQQYSTTTDSKSSKEESQSLLRIFWRSPERVTRPVTAVIGCEIPAAPGVCAVLQMRDLLISAGVIAFGQPLRPP